MPQITVDYSYALDHVDRRGFALALHPVVVETAAAQLEACKTRVLRTEDDVVGVRRTATEPRDRQRHARPARRPDRGDQGPAHRSRPGAAAQAHRAGRRRRACTSPPRSATSTRRTASTRR